MAGRPEQPDAQLLAHATPGDRAELLQRHADSALAPDDAEQLAAALADEHSARYLREIQATRSALAMLRDEVPVPADQPSAILEAHRNRKGKRRALGTVRLAGLAVAAAVLVVGGVWLVPETLKQESAEFAAVSTEFALPSSEPQWAEVAPAPAVPADQLEPPGAQPEVFAAADEAMPMTAVDALPLAGPAAGEASGEASPTQNLAMGLPGNAPVDARGTAQSLADLGALAEADASTQQAVVWVVRRADQSAVRQQSRRPAAAPGGATAMRAQEAETFNAVVQQWAMNNDLQPDGPELAAEARPQPERVGEPAPPAAPAAAKASTEVRGATLGESRAEAAARAPMQQQPAIVLELTPTQQVQLLDQLRQSGFEVAEAAAQTAAVTVPPDPRIEAQQQAPRFRQRVQADPGQQQATQPQADPELRTIFLQMAE